MLILASVESPGFAAILGDCSGITESCAVLQAL